MSIDRQKLNQLVAEYGSLPVVRANSRLSAQALLLAQRIQTFALNLLVLGEFKRGKSTLINALLGASILPTGAIPLTSVATVIIYSQEEHLTVTFLDGSNKRLPVALLDEYVTERANPNNAKQVSSVEVGIRAEPLAAGLRVVDTPGTGSVHQHNTQTTLDYLPNCDAAIFVFSADQPASASEIEFLKRSVEYTAKFFFVQNKSDLLSDTDRSESLDFLRTIVSAAVEEDVRIYPVSAKRALDARLASKSDPLFEEFENNLFKVLERDKAAIFQRSIAEKVDRLCSQARQLLQIQLRSLECSLEDLERSILQFRAASVTILRAQSDAEYVVKGEASQLVRDVEQHLHPIVAADASQIRASLLTRYEAAKQKSTRELIDALREELKEAIASHFNAWVKAENALVAQSFADINARFIRDAAAVAARISQVTEETLGIKLDVAFEVEPLSTDSVHYYAVDDPFTLSLQMVPLALPAFVSKPIIRKRFLAAIDHELSRNAGRLRADLQARIEKSTANFLAHFRSAVQQTLAEIEHSIDSALQMRSQRDNDTRALRDDCLRQLEAVEAIQKTLLEEGTDR